MFSEVSEDEILRLRRYQRKELTNEEIKKMCSYLENPTKVGIWTLRAKWANFGGISELVIDQLKKRFAKATESQAEKQKVKIKYKEDEQKEIIFNTRKLSFVFYLFAYLMNLEKQDSSFSMYLKSQAPDYRIITEDLLDLDDIKSKYSDAFEYFKKNIYFEGFNPIIKKGDIVKIKEGFFILYSKPAVNLEDLILISLNPENIEKMQVFYEKINKISDPKIMPIYSPEEEVFVPYFVFLESTFRHFIYNEHIVELFEKSISQYKDKNYPHCISTVGLILEDYLIQIYETLFRDVCPKDLAIGQLSKLIQSKIAAKFKREPEPALDIRPLYNAINPLVDKSSTNSSVEILKIMRDMLTYIKKSETRTHDLITSVRSKEISISIFPQTLINNIKEAIKNRNATSHRSTIPIGSYDALRTVYCCITLIMWWNNEKRLINWKESQEEILKKLIDRNSNMPRLESS